MQANLRSRWLRRARHGPYQAGGGHEGQQGVGGVCHDAACGGPASCVRMNGTGHTPCNLVPALVADRQQHQLQRICEIKLL